MKMKTCEQRWQAEEAMSAGGGERSRQLVQKVARVDHSRRGERERRPTRQGERERRPTSGGHAPLHVEGRGSSFDDVPAFFCYNYTKVSDQDTYLNLKPSGSTFFSRDEKDRCSIHNTYFTC